MLKISRQMMVPDFQAKVTPPKFRARRSMRVLPVIRKEPVQSIAFKPVQIGVAEGFWGMEKRRKMKTRAEMGTVLD